MQRVREQQIDKVVGQAAQGTFVVSGTGTMSIELGFRPESIDFLWLFTDSSSTRAMAIGQWSEDGGQYLTSTYGDHRNVSLNDCIGLSVNYSDWHTRGRVDSVSDTGFVMNIVDYSSNQLMFYRAIGRKP